MKKQNTIKLNMKKKEYASYFIDAFFFLVLFIVFLVDRFYCKAKISDYDSRFKETSIIIGTLLPCVVTILSISLSLSKEKIYGATRSEINDMRSGYVPSFTHVSIIRCVLFGLSFLFQILDLRVTNYVLEGVSLFYCASFCYQNIPIMAHSKKAIGKILKKNYLNVSRTHSLFETEATNTFNYRIETIVVTEGINTAYKMLDSKGIEKSAMMDFLMWHQNKLFEDVTESISNKLNNYQSTYNDLDIISAINKGYENINAVFEIVPTCKEIKIQYYQITRRLYALHRLCTTLGLGEKEASNVTEFINKTNFIIDYSSSPSPVRLSVVVSRIASTLNDGEVWFLDYLKCSSIYPSLRFNLNQFPLGFFISRIFHYLLKNEMLGDAEKKRLSDFINGKENNDEGEKWKEFFCQEIECPQSADISNSISRFLVFYKSVPETVFYFRGSKKQTVFEGDIGFTMAEVFHDWLLLIFASDWFGLDSSELPFVLDKLKEDEQKALADELSKNWLLKGKLRDDIDVTFLNTFGLDRSGLISGKRLQNETVDSLVSFHDNFYKQHVDVVNPKVDTSECSEQIINDFEGTIEKNSFYDSSLTIEDKTIHSIRFILREKNFERGLKAIASQFPSHLRSLICREVQKHLNIKKKVNVDYYYSNEDVRKIIESNSNLCSSKYRLREYANNQNSKYKNEIEKLHIKQVPGLIGDIYFKVGDIRFNAQIDRENSIVRPYSREELDQIIAEEYSPFDNGLYRYSDESQDETHDYYVTKEELINQLRKTRYYVAIFYTYVVKLNTNNILTFN